MTRQALPGAATDGDLLRRYRAGDVDAFMDLYQKHNRPLLAYARALGGDPSRAEDLVQETFVRLMKLDPRSVQASLRAYLYSVLRHLTADEARRGRVRREWADRERERLARTILLPLDRQDLSEGLASLPDEQREAVVLKVFGGLTLAEVAEVTGASEATATSRYRYALEKIARFLDGGGAP